MRLLIPILGAVPTAVLFEAVGVVKQVEEPMTRILAHSSTPPRSKVAVVQISDGDFREVFKGRHPLDPCQVQRIVNAIAGMGPLAIGVDLDTSDPAYRILVEGRCPEDKGGGAAPPGVVPVVWARRLIQSQVTGKFYAGDVLGGAGKAASAIAAVITDSDGVVRKYARSFPTDGGELLALPIALRVQAGLSRAADAKGERLIYFYGDRTGKPQRAHVSAGEILQAGGDPAIAGQFRNRIVLLGGDYQAEDEHPTPLGWMRGVEVLAHIAESDPKNTLPATRAREEFLILLGACLIAICFDMLNTPRALAVVMGGMAVGLLAGWFSSHLTRDTILIGTVLVVVICQQLCAKIKRAYQEESEAMKAVAEEAGRGGERQVRRG